MEHHIISQNVFVEVSSATFPGRWIGRVSSILWPSRSPNLTLPDLFFFLGYVNSYGCVDTVRDAKFLPNESVLLLFLIRLICSW
jgi:hypothetical protein